MKISNETTETKNFYSWVVSNVPSDQTSLVSQLLAWLFILAVAFFFMPKLV